MAATRFEGINGLDCSLPEGGPFKAQSGLIGAYRRYCMYNIYHFGEVGGRSGFVSELDYCILQHAGSPAIRASRSLSGGITLQSLGKGIVLIMQRSACLGWVGDGCYPPEL